MFNSNQPVTVVVSLPETSPPAGPALEPHQLGVAVTVPPFATVFAPELLRSIIEALL